MEEREGRAIIQSPVALTLGNSVRQEPGRVGGASLKTPGEGRSDSHARMDSPGLRASLRAVPEDGRTDAQETTNPLFLYKISYLIWSWIHKYMNIFYLMCFLVLLLIFQANFKGGTFHWRGA